MDQVSADSCFVHRYTVAWFRVRNGLLSHLRIMEHFFVLRWPGAIFRIWVGGSGGMWEFFDFGGITDPLTHFISTFAFRFNFRTRLRISGTCKFYRAKPCLL